MNLRLAAGLLLGLAVLPGCASNRPRLALDTVGPASGAHAARSPVGTLLVFSAFEQVPDLDGPDYRRRHSDYRILSADGEVLEKVRNDSGTLAEGPRPVELPSGNYRVVARANGYGEVTVPVVVRANHLTAVHLEGGVPFKRTTSAAAPEVVRLPNGEVVGWRSSENSLPDPALRAATTAAVGERR